VLSVADDLMVLPELPDYLNCIFPEPEPTNDVRPSCSQELPAVAGWEEPNPLSPYLSQMMPTHEHLR